MPRTALLLALLGLLAVLGAATPARRDDLVLVDDEAADVDPRVKLVDADDDSAWSWPTSRRPSGSTRWWRDLPKAYTTRYPYPSTTRRPITTTRRITTTTRRPTTTTRRPTPTLRPINDQSITIGEMHPYDRQLLSQTVYKSSTILTVHSEYLNYQHPTANIHCIHIVDLLKTGKNAVVTVQQGGIGQKQVSLKFKSQRGEKINYLAIIWGQ